MNAVAPKILLAVVTVSTVCGVGYVHHRQNAERAEMYEGVKRDIERQRQQMAQQQMILQEQKTFTENTGEKE